MYTITPLAGTTSSKSWSCSDCGQSASLTQQPITARSLIFIHMLFTKCCFKFKRERCGREGRQKPQKEVGNEIGREGGRREVGIERGR